MTPTQILAKLENLGASLSLLRDGEGIRVSAPKGMISDELRAELKEHKAEVLYILQKAELEGIKVDLDTIYPMIRKKVLTPKGQGILWQAFYCQIGVVLDKTPERVIFFNTEDPGFYILPMDQDD